LNQEAARLVGDLSHAQKQVYDQQSSYRQLSQKLESLQTVEQRSKVLEMQLAEKELHVESLMKQIVVETAKAEGLASQMRELEPALAAAQAKIDVQQGFAVEFRAYLDAKSVPIEDNTGKLSS